SAYRRSDRSRAWAWLLMFNGLPTGFSHSGNLTGVGQLAEAQAADLELAHRPAGASAQLAARVRPGRELRFEFALHLPTNAGHVFSRLRCLLFTNHCLLTTIAP